MESGGGGGGWGVMVQQSTVHNIQIGLCVGGAGIRKNLNFSIINDNKKVLKIVLKDIPADY